MQTPVSSSINKASILNCHELSWVALSKKCEKPSCYDTSAKASEKETICFSKIIQECPCVSKLAKMCLFEYFTQLEPWHLFLFSVRGLVKVKSSQIQKERMDKLKCSAVKQTCKS